MNTHFLFEMVSPQCATLQGHNEVLSSIRDFSSSTDSNISLILLTSLSASIFNRQPSDASIFLTFILHPTPQPPGNLNTSVQFLLAIEN